MQYPRLYRLHGEMQLPYLSVGLDEKQPGMWHLQMLHRSPAAAKFQLPRCPVRVPPDIWQLPSSAAAGPAEQQSTQGQVSICRGLHELSAQHPAGMGLIPRKTVCCRSLAYELNAQRASCSHGGHLIMSRAVRCRFRPVS